MSIFYVDGDQSIDFTKVCGTQKSCSGNNGLVVYLDSGHTVSILPVQLDSFRKAYETYRENADYLRPSETWEEPLEKGCCHEA